MKITFSHILVIIIIILSSVLFLNNTTTLTAAPSSLDNLQLSYSIASDGDYYIIVSPTGYVWKIWGSNDSGKIKIMAEGQLKKGQVSTKW